MKSVYGKMSSETVLESYLRITKELLESILYRESSSSASINQINVQSAVEEGENYSSQLLRVRIDYEIDEEPTDRRIRCKSLIIKASLGNKLVRSRNVFAKEIEVFIKIIPAAEQMFHGLGFDIRFAPTCHDSSSIDSYLILADLIADNYKNVPRQDGLNSDQLKACLKLLSKWHAGSVALLHKKNWTLQKQYALFLQPHVSVNGSKQYRSLFENAVSSCIDVFQDDTDLDLIRDKLAHLLPNIFQECCDAVQCDPSEFNVLTHGDLWSNNIMFDASDNVERLLFLDFQMCYWGSPILDVAYLLFTSSAATVTASDWDALIEYYFNELISVLQQLECSAISPSKEHFYQQFHNRAVLGAAFSLFSVPMRMMDRPPSDAIIKFLDVSDEGQKYRHQIYSEVNTRKLLKALLLYFDEKRLLDQRR